MIAATHGVIWGGQVEESHTDPVHTAVEEAKEESNDTLNYDPEGLRQAPSVDFAMPNTPDGSYRLIIAPTQYQPASRMTEHLAVAKVLSRKEYGDFRWVKLADLMRGIEHDQGTMEVAALREETPPTSLPYNKKAPTEKIKIHILPDMKALLRQQDFQVALEKITRLSPDNLWTPLTTHHIARSVARTMDQQAEVILTLRKRFKQTAHSTASSSALPTPLSEEHLNRLLGTEGVGLSLEQKVDLFLDKHAVGHDEPNAYDADLRRQLVAAIRNEAAYQAAGYSTFYHAVPREIAILYDLYTAVYQKLTRNPEAHKLRWSEFSFREWPTLELFMAHFKKASGEINNYSPGYQAAALAANYSAVGSPFESGSASYRLLANDSGITSVYPFKEQSVFEEMLASAGMPQSLITLLLSKMNSLLQETQDMGGTLYQIHLPQSVVDTCVYPAFSHGIVFRPIGEHSTLSDLLTYHADNPDVIQKLQVRIVLIPEAMRQAKYTTYTHHSHDSDSEYREIIDDTARLIAEEIFVEQGVGGTFLKRPMGVDVLEGSIQASTGEKRDLNLIQEF
jgi:hypothetical protein